MHAFSQRELFFVRLTQETKSDEVAKSRIIIASHPPITKSQSVSLFIRIGLPHA